MIDRKFLTAGISGLAMALVLAPQAAFAQDADEPAAEEDADAEGNLIIVSGFRESLESAVAEKRNSDQIVESVTAEDIGRLPDASIGESIARLPGLTSQRLNGRANVISIRGFGPDFSQTLLNGREQTTTSDNRSVELDQYPSEIVSQVVVYKSPTASLVGQGLVGTVDIRTVRPLETGKQVLAIGARGSYADLGKLNAGSRELGYRVNGAYVDQFADDTIGISLAASYVDEPYQLQEFNAWGYAGDGSAGNPSVIGGSKSFVTSTRLKRLGVNGTLQAQATDTIMLTFDGFYSNFKDDQSKRGVELPLGFGAFGTTTTIGTVEDGFATSGTFNNVRGVVRNDIFQRKADLYSFGFNARHEGDDGWKAFFDVGYSRTDRNELSLESYAGTGFNGDDTGNGAAASIGFQSGPTGTVFNPSLDYSDPSVIFLTDPLGWGGGGIPQAGYWNNRIIDDELWQFRAEVEKELENSFLSSVQFGMNYTTREKSLTPDEAFVRLPNGALTAAVPTQFQLRSTDLGFLGLGPIVSYDARDLIDAGVLVLEPRLTSGPNAANDVIGKGFTVNEDLMTLYLQANIYQELGAGTLTGNFGVQAVNTNQDSTGFIFPPAGPEQRTFGDSFWDVLPSANLSLRLNSDTVIRLAASREIMRPRLDDMRLSIGFGIDATGGPDGIIRGGGGNPFLRPYRANAVDFNVEQYFGQGGVIALQLFYKDIKSFIFNGRFDFDFSSFPEPTGAAAFPNLPTIGTLDAPVNTGGGDLYGGELAVTMPLGSIVSALEGFGITGGASYTETNVEDANGNETQIPGYSKWVVNATAYFEKWGFNSRVSARYRSTFLGDFTGFGGTPTRRTALGETIIDAQIGYDFQEGSPLEGLSLYLQGQNLTDERFASVGGNRLQVVDYQIYGRRFLAGFTYRF